MSSTSLNLAAFKNLQYRLNDNPLLFSVTIHVSIVIVSLAIVFFPDFKKENVEITILETVKAPSKTMPVSRTMPKPQPKKMPRAVFGLSRKSLTSDQGETVKAGNTVAKEIDDTKLKPSDADSLPVPVDEYLVSRMPELMQEVKVPYPSEAKKNKVTGAVIMDILIDSLGIVRDAKLVQGPNPELCQAALSAVLGFKFKPAIVQDKSVAVRIRYAYRFVLEN